MPWTMTVVVRSSLNNMGSVLKILVRMMSSFGAIITLSLANSMVMSGNAFSVRKRITVPGTGTVDIVFDPTGVTVGKKVVFLPLSFNGIGGPVNIDIYNGVIANDDGTLLPVYNRSFVIGSQPESIARLSPTGVDITGLTAIELLLPSDGTSAVATSGADAGDPLVSDIDLTKKVLIRLTNTAGPDAATVGIKADFFEVDQ